MKRRYVAILGFCAGVCFAVLWDSALIVRHPGDLVAISHGSRRNGQLENLYLAKVFLTPFKNTGTYDVQAQIQIGGGSYFQTFNNFQPIGKVTNKTEAIAKYGRITWEAERVVISGTEGEKASVQRADLEKHR